MCFYKIGIFVIVGTLLVSACKKDQATITPVDETTNPNCGNVNISVSGSSESHNFGQNCMSCHSSAGNGDGCFVAAGSVSTSTLTTPITSGTVKLYSSPNGAGNLVSTIQIDGNGNFHTTENISVTGLYPAITGSNGVPHYMSSSLTSGACNSCHGSSTSKLWAN